MMKTRLKNAIVITCDDEFNVFYDGEICVDGNKIVSVGERNTNFNADIEIDCCGDVLMPGFVCVSFNPFTNFLNKHYSQDEEINYENNLKLKSIEPSDVYELTYYSALKMQSAGITFASVGGVCENEILDALSNSKIRANIKLDVSEGDKEQTERKIAAIKTGEMQSLSFLVVPWFLTKQTSFSDCAFFAKKMNTFSMTPVCSTLFEVGECDKQFSLTPISLLEKNGFFDYPCVIENSIYIEKEDIEILKEFDVSVCVDAESTLQNGNGIFPLARFLNKDINVCLGLSGNNFCFDVFKQLNLLSLVNCGNLSRNNVIKDEELLKMATRNGAKAVGLGDKIGSIKEDYFADIIRVSTKNFVDDKKDVLRFLTNSASSGDIVFTMIDGDIVFDSDEKTFAKKLCDIKEKICKNIVKIDKKLN